MLYPFLLPSFPPFCVVCVRVCERTLALPPAASDPERGSEAEAEAEAEEEASDSSQPSACCSSCCCSVLPMTYHQNAECVNLQPHPKP